MQFHFEKRINEDERLAVIEAVELLKEQWDDMAEIEHKDLIEKYGAPANCLGLATDEMSQSDAEACALSVLKQEQEFEHEAETDHEDWMVNCKMRVGEGDIVHVHFELVKREWDTDEELL